MANDRIRVYFTVDTETTMGGAWTNPEYSPMPLDRFVFGRCGSKFFGIPLIMDILEKHGYRATFFTEVFCAYVVGIEEVRRVFRDIGARGHDAQLHLHPVYRFFRDYRNGGPRREIDLMWRLPPEEQRQLIAEGVALFGELSGLTPRVYRAGCYGASELTLSFLKENGIEIDSSYNLAYRGQSCGFKTDLLNAPAMLSETYEFPVTVFRVGGGCGFKPLEVGAVSVGEILATIRAMHEAGCRDVVLSLHSFSLLKNPGTRGDDYGPDRIVIRRLEKLCAAISALKDVVEVSVMGEAELAADRFRQPQVVPDMGWVRPAARKVLQGLNRMPWL